jgi:hypothetical protein
MKKGNSENYEYCPWTMGSEDHSHNKSPFLSLKLNFFSSLHGTEVKLT